MKSMVSHMEQRFSIVTDKEGIFEQKHRASQEEVYMLKKVIKAYKRQSSREEIARLIGT